MINSVPQQPHGIRQRVPILGQQQQLTKQQQEQMAIIQMASGVYVQLAVAHIASRDLDLDPDVNVLELRQLAKKCMIAAKAFFEGIGVIQTQTKNDSEVEPDDVEVRDDERRV